MGEGFTYLQGKSTFNFLIQSATNIVIHVAHNFISKFAYSIVRKLVYCIKIVGAVGKGELQ